MKEITHIESSNRMSRAVIHNNTVYLSGVVPSNSSGNISLQTKDVLDQIEAVLIKAGTNKSRLLMAQIWLTDINRDFSDMNAVWEEWLDPAGIPARATGEVKLASENILIEITVTAAI